MPDPPSPTPDQSPSVGMNPGAPTFFETTVYADVFRHVRWDRLKTGVTPTPVMTTLPHVDHKRPFRLLLRGDIKIRLAVEKTRYETFSPRSSSVGIATDVFFAEGMTTANFQVLELGDGASAELYYPGCDASKRFHPEYVKALKPFKCLRGLDWLAANGDGNAINPVVEWQDRTRVDQFGQHDPQGASPLAFFRFVQCDRVGLLASTPSAGEQNAMGVTA